MCVKSIHSITHHHHHHRPNDALWEQISIMGVVSKRSDGWCWMLVSPLFGQLCQGSVPERFFSHVSKQKCFLSQPLIEVKPQKEYFQKYYDSNVTTILIMNIYGTLNISDTGNFQNKVLFEYKKTNNQVKNTLLRGLIRCVGRASQVLGHAKR